MTEITMLKTVTMAGQTLTLGQTYDVDDALATRLIAEAAASAATSTPGVQAVTYRGVAEKVVYTLTARAVAMALVDTNKAAGGALLGALPVGAVKALVTRVDLQLTTNLGATAEIVGGVGTAISSNDGDLGDAGEADLVPSTAITFAASAADFEAISSAAQEITLDGRSAAKNVYLNFASAVAGAEGKTVTATGTITIIYVKA